MNTLLMSLENCKTNQWHGIALNLRGKTNIKLKNKTQKYIFLSDLSIYYKWRNIKKPYISN